MQTKKLTFEQFCDPQSIRNEQIKIKSEATWVAITELNGLLNLSALARDYFKRTPSWVTQRINGYKVGGKPARFTEAEYHELAEAFRNIARRLEAHAAEIDAATMDQE